SLLSPCPYQVARGPQDLVLLRQDRALADGAVADARILAGDPLDVDAAAELAVAVDDVGDRGARAAGAAVLLDDEDQAARLRRGADAGGVERVEPHAVDHPRA